MRAGKSGATARNDSGRNTTEHHGTVLESHSRTVGRTASGLSPAGRHFHWVETPNPAAMKPKPTRMFQFRQPSTGQLPLVT